jgi:sodium transport system permease protein
MQWKNVKLIYLREMRDQLRDRRTLFLIAVLPLLLYPLLGMSFFQLSQFLQHHAAKVLVLGEEELQGDWLPRLLDEQYFDARLFDDPSQRENLQVAWAEDFPDVDLGSRGPQSGNGADQPHADGDNDHLEAATRKLLDEGRIEAVLQFPPGFGDRLSELRQSLLDRQAGRAADEADFPEPVILFNSANEKSQLAQLRVEQVLRKWRAEVTEKNLADSDVPMEAARPFELQPRDVALERQRHAAVWSKILPFIVFIWALTGAFYPAVDLCAGEKERGTLETLLTSPALRREIVWGKLLTVMTFSTVTAMLNLTSMGITGKFVIDQLSQVSNLGDQNPLSMPPLLSLVWLVAALVPISALFSALCLACAAFARSTKEGQYYLMPLMLVSMPLMMLPMSPGVELNLGNSLIPLTGVVLLLRSVIEGQYHLAWPFVAPVAGVTLACGLLAIRWAEEQFNRESVLFREGERLELRRWLVHVVRDRGDTPSLAQAVLCAAVILVVQFFISVALSSQAADDLSFDFFARAILISQLACVFAPAAIMTLVLTRKPMRTLLLERFPHWSHVAAAAALAVALHPLAVRLAEGIGDMYPVQGEVRESMEGIQDALARAPNWWVVLALMALLPAICEEIAVRGFILSGLRHVGHKWWAISISAVAFGAIHMFLQQKITAAAAGLVIGFIAVQTGSLIPCIVFHAIHNGLAVSLPTWGAAAKAADPGGPLARLLGGDHPLIYHPAAVVACGVAAAAILWRLHGITYRRTPEEQLEEARQRQESSLVGA